MEMITAKQRRRTQVAAKLRGGRERAVKGSLPLACLVNVQVHGQISNLIAGTTASLIGRTIPITNLSHPRKIEGP